VRQEKLVKSDLSNEYLPIPHFFLNRYVINDCEVFSGHIGNGVRWTPVNTGNW
jgi:hypothetical protein